MFGRCQHCAILGLSTIQVGVFHGPRLKLFYLRNNYLTLGGTSHKGHIMHFHMRKEDTIHACMQPFYTYMEIMGQSLMEFPCDLLTNHMAMTQTFESEKALRNPL